MKIQFQSDKFAIKGPKVDNSYIVSFEIGEYQIANIKELIGINDKVLNITIDVEE